MNCLTFSFIVLLAVAFSTQEARAHNCRTKTTSHRDSSAEGCTYPEWVKGTEYCGGQMVSHYNEEYEAKFCTLNEPGYSSDWTDLRPCFAACRYPDWVQKEYKGGEYVTHNMKEYVSKWDTINEPGVSSDWDFLDDCTPEGCKHAEWVQGVQYCGGERISHYNEEYEAKFCTLNEPGNSSDWTDLGPCFSACRYPDWVQKEYKGGEYVTHNMMEYVSRFDTLNEPGVSSDWEFIDECTPTSKTKVRAQKRRTRTTSHRSKTSHRSTMTSNKQHQRCRA